MYLETVGLLEKKKECVNAKRKQLSKKKKPETRERVGIPIVKFGELIFAKNFLKKKRKKKKEKRKDRKTERQKDKKTKGKGWFKGLKLE